jgi:hypothetical protein
MNIECMLHEVDIYFYKEIIISYNRNLPVVACLEHMCKNAYIKY